MRILLVHADFMDYHVKEKAIDEVEELNDANKEGHYDNVLVSFTSVEEGDERNVEPLVKGAAEEITDVFQRVKASVILLYPYAHLSSNLASPAKALEIMKRLEDELRSRGFKVARAPFGWYKAFKMSCKGHPLAELSKTIKSDEVVKKETKLEEEKGYYVLVEPSGNIINLSAEKPQSDGALAKYPLVKRLLMNELGVKPERGVPVHIKLMQRLELVDYEAASDVGHFKFLPKGSLVKHLLEELALDIAVNDVGATVVETPMIYRLSVPEIAEQASKFLERDYRFKANGEEFTLRFAGDFGLFSMMKKATISYKQLPLRVYELSRSFRLEKRGECVGLRRLRSFTMPDIHCFCRDIDQGKEEFLNLLKKYMRLVSSMMIDHVITFRVVESFFKDNLEWFKLAATHVGEPLLIEVLPSMKHYWIVKEEHQFIDSQGNNAQLCTVQLDVEDSKRYDIGFIDKDNKKKGCIIVHSSMGSVERWIYAMLEQAEKNKMKGEAPMLPTWLSPIQVRVIPVSAEYLDKAVQVVEEFERAGIRGDVDDREESVPKKVREAEVEWIPYIVVVGKKEVEEGTLSVRVRSKKETLVMTLRELISIIVEECKGKPKARLWLPKLLSLRPKFI